MRQIDADALQKNIEIEIESAKRNGGRDLIRGLRIAARRVKHAPAIEAVPVVHARWIRDDLGNARCSNCHTRLPFRHCYDDDDGYEWDDEIDETPWCMHCGARMDGDPHDSGQ